MIVFASSSSSSSSSSSGIPEAVDSIISDGLGVGMLAIIAVLTIVTFSLVGYYTDERLGWREGWVFLSAATASIIVFSTGGLVFKTLTLDSKTEIAEATRQNIQENFDMQDIDVENVDGYSEQNKSVVYGSSDGRILEFEVGYSAEYDVMMPIVEPEDLNALPVKEGSTLDSVLVAEDTVEEDAETVIVED